MQKPILTIPDALAAKSFFPPVLAPIQYGKDIDQALKESKHTLSVSPSSVFLSLFLWALALHV